MIALLRMEIIQYPRQEVMLLGFAVSSVLIGTLVSLVVSRRAMAPRQRGSLICMVGKLQWTVKWEKALHLLFHCHAAQCKVGVVFPCFGGAILVPPPFNPYHDIEESEPWTKGLSTVQSVKRANTH